LVAWRVVQSLAQAYVDLDQAKQAVMDYGLSERFEEVGVLPQPLLSTYHASFARDELFFYACITLSRRVGVITHCVCEGVLRLPIRSAADVIPS
jgi:hypothetical protein